MARIDAPLSDAATWRRLAIPALVAATAVAAWLVGASELISAEHVFARRAWLRDMVDAHWLVAVAAYAVAYVAAAALAAPGGAMTMIGGFLFGPAWGAAVAVVSATTGATILYLLARAGLSAARLDRAGPTLTRLRAGFDKGARSWLLFMRLTPLFPFPVVTFAAAAFGAKLWTFAWTTMLGIAPAAIAYATAGAGLDGMLAGQARAFDLCVAAGGDCRLDLSLGAILTPQMLGALAALGVLALIPVAVQFWRGCAARGGGA